MSKDAKNVPALRFKGYSDAWEKRKYGDITKSFQYGLNAPAKKFDGINKYLRITDIDDHTRLFKQESLTSPDTNLSNASTYLLKQGDVLFARTGASTGKTYKYRKRDGKVYFAGFLIRAELKPKFDSEFFYQTTLTDSFLDFVKVTSQRSGQPGINSKEYANKAIQVPELSEQQRIGSVLAIYDNLIAATQHKIDALEQAKKALLQRLFDQSWRFKGYSDPWEKRKLGEISPLRGGFAFKSSEFKDKGIPIIRISNIKSDGKVGGDFVYYHEQEVDQSYLLPQRAALLAMSGATTGKVAILHKQHEGKYYQNQRVGYFSKVKDASYSFISVLIRSDLFLKQLKSVLVAGAQPNVSSKEIDQFIFSVPVTLNEQEKIGAFFEYLDSLIAATQSRLFSLELLKKSLLQDLFI